MDFFVLIQQRFICRSSDSTLAEDAWIESNTLATLALALSLGFLIQEGQLSALWLCWGAGNLRPYPSPSIC
jgi:hypothetical protein